MTNNKFYELNVVDNFLDEDSFIQIKKLIYKNSSFPWYINQGVSTHNADDGIYFTHMFYQPYAPHSSYWEIIQPLIKAIDPIAIHRVKGNFYPSSLELVRHGMHSDMEISHKGCIFYLNTNNGKTIFSEDTQIESIENRALFFDPSIPHQSTNCTDDPIGRFNININYF